MLATNCSSQIVTLPTRVTQTTLTAIDHILTNDHLSWFTPGVIRTDLSDHCVFSNSMCGFQAPHHQLTNPHLSSCLRQFDPATYNSELDNNLTSLLTKYTEVTPDNINSVYDGFINVVKNAIDTYAPLKVLSRK